MDRPGLSWVAIVVCLLLPVVVSCSDAASSQTTESRPVIGSATADDTEETSGPEPAGPEVVEPPEPERAELFLETLSVEEKVGQLFMPVVAGHDATTVTEAEAAANIEFFGYETPAEIVEAYKLGGVIYLGNNISSADQVTGMSAGLQSAARSDSGIGLLVAIDQEGGRVNRLTDGVTVFPAASILAGDAEAVHEAGYLTGRQVALQGINVVLAPVADVVTTTSSGGVIGNRSYGGDPDLVAEMVRASVSGLQDSGVAAAVKHWPGHGSTEVDSHLRLPVVDIARQLWEDRDRVPFEAAIDEGVAIVLVGHLAFTELDPQGSPATVSPVIIDDLLRNELAFDGVVMTDALNMGAVEGIAPGELVVQSIEAGADILLVPPDLPTGHAALLEAVESGRLTETRLDEAVLRVLRLKDELGLLPPPPDDASEEGEGDDGAVNVPDADAGGDDADAGADADAGTALPTLGG